MSQSTGCSQPELLERLYQHFAQPSAWDVYPGAQDALKRIRATGTLHGESLMTSNTGSFRLRTMLLFTNSHTCAAQPLEQDLLACMLPCLQEQGAEGRS